MMTWIQLGTTLVLTLVCTLTVAAIIWRPLHGVLELICQAPAAARFWTTFSAVMLVCGPLFLVSFAASRSQSMAEFIRQAVCLCALGLIGAFIIMGLAVRNAGHRRQAQQASPRVNAPEAPAA